MSGGSAVDLRRAVTGTGGQKNAAVAVVQCIDAVRAAAARILSGQQ